MSKKKELKKLKKELEEHSFINWDEFTFLGEFPVRVNEDSIMILATTNVVETFEQEATCFRILDPCIYLYNMETKTKIVIPWNELDENLNNLSPGLKQLHDSYLDAMFIDIVD